MSYYLWIDNIYKKYTNHSISEATTWKKEYYLRLLSIFHHDKVL